jgi:hypothetical protein
MAEPLHRRIRTDAENLKDAIALLKRGEKVMTRQPWECGETDSEWTMATAQFFTRLAEDRKMARILEAQQPAPASEPAPDAEPSGSWLIHFDDADVKPEIFAGPGAEAAARSRCGDLSASWNVTLFREAAMRAESEGHR